MKLSPTLLTALFGLLLLSRSEAIRPGTQPRAEAAIEALQTARDSKDPLPLLEKAKQLVPGKKKEGTRRDDAVEAIEKAIELVKKGQDPTAKITHAISMMKSSENRQKVSNGK